MHKKITVFVILIFSLLNYGFDDANGLSCQKPINVLKSYDSSEMVFLGHAVSKEFGQVFEYEVQGQIFPVDGEIVQFEIKEFFKGAPQDLVTVITYDSTWRTTFETGRDYIVYAEQRNSGMLEEEECTKTGSPYLIDIFQLKLLKLFDSYFFHAIVIGIGAVIIAIFVRRRKKLAS